MEIYKLTDQIFSRCKKTEPELYSWIFCKFPEKPARFCLFLSCPHISANKLFKTAILLEQGAHRGRKIVFGRWPLFSRYLKSVKKVSYAFWMRLILVLLRRLYYKIIYIRALSCFLKYIFILLKTFTSTSKTSG